MEIIMYGCTGKEFITLGSERSSAMFEDRAHLSCYKIFIKTGRCGETVVVEVDKRNPAYAEILLDTYMRNPISYIPLTRSFRNMMDDLRYAIPNESTMKACDDNSPMRWILASRETGSMKEMFEPAPKKTDKPLVESGKKQEIYFDKTAVVKKSGKEAEPEARAVKDPNVPYLQSLRGDNYFIWEYQGRFYVVGSPETGEYFQKEKQLPAAKTILNAGPNGETVVFEADENDPFLAARLVEEFIYGEPEDAREKEPEKNSVQSKTADNDSPEGPCSLPGGFKR